jgi:hypothetical protein
MIANAANTLPQVRYHQRSFDSTWASVWIAWTG